jgi:PDZ domain
MRCLPLLSAALFLLPLASAASAATALDGIRPGSSKRTDLRATLGDAVESEKAGTLLVESYRRPQEGLAEVTAWYDAKRALLFACVRLVRDLDAETASLLFDLEGEPRVLKGNPFSRLLKDSGETHAFSGQGIYFCLRDGVVREIWLTGSDTPPDRILETIENPGAAGGDGDQKPSATGWLGLIFQQVIRKQGEPRVGARILGLLPGGAAQRAGLRAGDIVVALDGKRVIGLEALARDAARRKPGAMVVLDVIRGGRHFKVTVPILAFSEQEEAKVMAIYVEGIMGLGAETLDAEAARRLGIGKTSGIYVRRVHSGSHAQLWGLIPGDVIESIDGAPVTNIQQFLTVIRRLPARMKIARGQKSMILKLSYPKRRGEGGRRDR